MPSKKATATISIKFGDNYEDIVKSALGSIINFKLRNYVSMASKHIADETNNLKPILIDTIKFQGGKVCWLGVHYSTHFKNVTARLDIMSQYSHNLMNMCEIYSETASKNLKSVLSPVDYELTWKSDYKIKSDIDNLYCHIYFNKRSPQTHVYPQHGNCGHKQH